MSSEAMVYPQKLTYCAQVSAEFFNNFPRIDLKNVLRLERFTGYFLVEVDRHDRDNYPPHPRSFLETVRIYHPDVGEVQSIVEFETRMTNILDESQLDIPEVWDWTCANLVWEHIMGGGNREDIPKEWGKYLSAKINGLKIGYPDEKCIRLWKDFEIEQQVEIYRYVTNSYFAKAVCGCLELNYCDGVLGLLNIYQLLSDCHHIKNPGEPIMSKILDEINTRCSHSMVDEVLHIATVTGLNPLVARGAYVMGSLLSGMSKKAEWDD